MCSVCERIQIIVPLATVVVHLRANEAVVVGVWVLGVGLIVVWWDISNKKPNLNLEYFVRDSVPAIT
jgi:hypothetical protein